MIEIDGVGMSYEAARGRLDVLSDVSVRVTGGETVAIVGPSGSGKTTLLILLAGLERPTTGRIRVDGTEITDLDGDALADLRRDRVGIVFQSFHLVPSLTALGNVALPLEIAGRSGARERARAMLGKVGLADRENHYPTQLSGGEQQRVAIARALVHTPKVVLADEPTGNLDLATGARVIDLLFDLNSTSGSTMVLVTHDEAIARRCSRVLRLENGTLVEDATHSIPV